MQDLIIKRSEAMNVNESLFSQIIELFPYPIAVFSSTGSMEVSNSALKAAIGISREEAFTCKYNIFEDAPGQDSRLLQAVRQAISGETVYLLEVNDPLRVHRKLDQKIKYGNYCCYNVVVFPVKNSGADILHAVIVLVDQK